MRNYMKERRLNVKTPLRPVKTPIPGLTMEGNRIVGVQSRPETFPVPIYNPSKHKAGDRVMVRQGNRWIEMVLPELDKDGNAIPEF